MILLFLILSLICIIQPPILFENKITIIIPFRNRLKELTKLLSNLNRFLPLEYTIIVVNQEDTYRFNRGALLNIGFLHALPCTNVLFHDVDLIPLNNCEYIYSPNNLKSRSAKVPFNISKRLDKSLGVGGAIKMSCQDFMIINGFSNRFWGWGREDDEFLTRLESFNIGLSIDTPIRTDRWCSYYHDHDSKERPRDMVRYRGQLKDMSRAEGHIDSGLINLKYTVQSAVNISVDNVKAQVISISLDCNLLDQPWCQHHIGVKRIRSKSGK
ncbi:hypothetical protein GJ496_007472 [Pomphorhynchus laevis]|nr:hypothetical protein GJ496_007472 [Pomphorhynchus laevis]